MRVLQIGDDWPAERAGGLNSYFSELVRNLNDLEVQCEGLVVGDENVASSSGGAVHAFAKSSEGLAKRMLKARQASLKLLRERPVDLISTHFALYAAPILDQLYKTPSVVHFHGPWAAESGLESSRGLAARAKAQFERRVYASADRLIVLSEAFKKELIKGYGVRPDRIRIVPGGVDTKRFNVQMSRSEARTRLGWPQDRQVLLCVRRQIRRMGLENLIDAVKEVTATNSDLILYLGGSGYLAADIIERVKQLGMEKQIKHLGRISDEDLPLAYRAADFSIVPSQALEGFGLIAVESLASGTPVLVTPVGGLPEVIRPFAPQCVFEDISMRAISEGLAHALKTVDSSVSEEKCRSYAVDHFAWPTIASQIVAIYKDAL